MASAVFSTPHAAGANLFSGNKKAAKNVPQLSEI
jgi:hypothetical protein